MNAPLHVRTLRIHPLAIPMRIRFEHAAATRVMADPVIVELTAGAPYAHEVGYGETLARHDMKLKKQDKAPPGVVQVNIEMSIFFERSDKDQPCPPKT